VAKATPFQNNIPKQIYISKQSVGPEFDFGIKPAALAVGQSPQKKRALALDALYND
jgi:hypothetical protein